MIQTKMRRGSVLTLLLVFLLQACEHQGQSKTYPLHYSDAIMGTTFTIKASAAPDSIDIDELKLKIKGLLDQINGVMSTYEKESELSLINKSDSRQWISVSKSLYAVLKEAKEINQLTKGAFDITVGSLVNLWGFGPDSMSFTAPDNDLIKQKLKNIGFKNLQFRHEARQISKSTSAIYLDLSAIAKGYAVDQVAQLLENNGIVDYMVEIGGELKLKGHNVQQKPWRIAVEKPSAEKRMLQKVLPLSNTSLATSGDYRNFFEIDNVRFSHTIDPRTGYPIRHKLASVTILSDTTMRADALATAMMVLGYEQGMDLAEKEQISALFIIKTDGGFVEKSSSAFIKALR